MMKAVVLVAVFLVSTYAEVTKEDRERIQKYLLDEAKNLALEKIIDEEAFKEDVNRVPLDVGKSGQCVQDNCDKTIQKGKPIIEEAYGQYIILFQSIADAAFVIEDERMEFIKQTIDSGDLQAQLKTTYEELWKLLNKILEQLKDSIKECQ